jgi:DNA-directed RNA polymerase specialized sigma24 family protein
MIADDADSLTDWIQKRNSPVPAEREEAARRITAAFDSDLRRLIETQLGKKLQGKVGASDLIQDVFARLFSRDNEFRNRNAMFAYLKKAALHKLANLRKHYCCQMRDVRREVPEVTQQSDGLDSHPGILEQGEKVVPLERADNRNYRRDVQPDPAPVDSVDSFINDGPVELMAYGALPEDAALVIDLVESLGDHDRIAHDCLQQIVSLSLEGFGPVQIAERLGIAKRTVERKRELLQRLLDLGKLVTVRIERQADASERIPLNVLPTDTTESILRRAGTEAYHLCREMSAKSVRHFSANELVYPHVAEGDTLRALSQ